MPPASTKDYSIGQRTAVAEALLTIERFMRGAGLDYESAVRAAGIDPNVVNVPDALIPLRSLARLVKNVAQETNNDAFGAQLGAAFQRGTTGMLDYLISNAPTLRAALKDYVRYLALVSDGLGTHFDERPRMSYIVVPPLPAAFGPSTQLIDSQMAVRVTRIRYIVHQASFPLLVELERSKPKAIAEFRRIFGSVCFGQAENRIGIASSLLDRSIPAADPQLYKVLVQAAEKTLAERKQSIDPLASLIAYIDSRLPHGEVDIAAAAKAMSLTPRGLRRQLERAGTNFRELSGETRKAMAHHYICETTLPMTEITFRLGFSELSAFSRAAKIWFGCSPRELRKRARG